MTIFRLELKKAVINKFFAVSTFLLIGYFVWFTIAGIRDMTCYPDGSAELYKNIRNEKTNVQQLDAYLQSIVVDAFTDGGTMNTATVGEYGENLHEDYWIVSKGLEQIKYANGVYTNDMLTLVKNLHLNAEKAALENNRYEARYYEKAVELYNVKTEVQIMDSNSAYAFLTLFHFGWESRVFSILFIIWAAFLSVYCFQYEKQHRVHEVVFSSRFGRRKLYLRKISVLLFLITFVSVCITIVELCCGIVCFHICDFSAPIQSLPQFEYCPFRFTLMEFFLVLNCLRMLSLVFVIGVAMLCSLRAKSLTRPLALSVGILGSSCYMLVVLTGLHGLDIANIFAVVRTYFPLALSQPEMYFTRFDYTKFFGIPVSRLLICLCVLIIFFGTCISISCNNYGKAGKHNG